MANPLDAARRAAQAARNRAELITWKSGYHEYKGPLHGLSQSQINAIYAKREQELRDEERAAKLKAANERIEQDRLKALGKAKGKVPREEQSANRAARAYTQAQGRAAEARTARVRAEEAHARARRGSDTDLAEKTHKTLVQAQRAERRANDDVTKAKRESEKAEGRLRDARAEVQKIERAKRR